LPGGIGKSGSHALAAPAFIQAGVMLNADSSSADVEIDALTGKYLGYENDD
jgi:hypothetical protein